MPKAQDCGLGVSEFEPQSHYYVYFRTNNQEKGMNLIIFQAILSLLLFHNGGIK